MDKLIIGWRVYSQNNVHYLSSLSSLDKREIAYIEEIVRLDEGTFMYYFWIRPLAIGGYVDSLVKAKNKVKAHLISNGYRFLTDIEKNML